METREQNISILFTGKRIDRSKGYFRPSKVDSNPSKSNNGADNNQAVG
tara:strand:+ start:557 stop:700 length:144 start_codon:yes stop_codon:yes gene_type:complete